MSISVSSNDVGVYHILVGSSDLFQNKYYLVGCVRLHGKPSRQKSVLQTKNKVFEGLVSAMESAAANPWSQAIQEAATKVQMLYKK